jgi:GT2 family glycosyltransferase
MAVESIMKNSDPALYELIIVDNGSRPEMKSYFDSLMSKIDITYVRNEMNAGPIRAINQGIKAAKGEYVMAIHNDVIIMEDGWLNKIVSTMEKDPTVGLIGLAGRKEIYNTVIDGLCFVLRRELINRIGGLDEAYGYMHCYDLDLSLASIDAGFKNVVVNVSALHIGNGGMTRKLQDYKDLVKDDYGLLKKNCKILAKKWRRLLPLKVA